MKSNHFFSCILKEVIFFKQNNISTKYICISLISLLLWTNCQQKKPVFDASGTFEATEIIVSAEATGKILALTIKEGSVVKKGEVVGKIDPLSIELQKEQIEASMTALGQKSVDATPQVAVLNEQMTVQRSQIAVQKQQLVNLLREQKRFESLGDAGIIPTQKRDEINGQVDVLKKQIEATEAAIQVFERQISAQKAAISTQNRSISSEKLPLEKRVKQLNDQIARTQIANPIDGTVLSKYAEIGEVTTVGRAIYKVADMSEMTLRVYITGGQLSQLKINQNIKVFIDESTDNYREMTGTIAWISDKAEFTPKTIQTKEERANLVYAVKIKVKNDGALKIGQYAEIKFL